MMMEPSLEEALASSVLSSNFWIQGTGRRLAQKYAIHIWVSAMLYLPILWILGRWMRSRPAYRLKGVSVAWNMALSILSGLGVYMFLWYDAGIIFRPVVHETGYHPCIRAAIVTFSLTKALEFGDTILLVLKKKPLIFLHVWHHLTVVLYCWHAQLADVNFAHMMVFFNLAIHTVMYFYYAMAVLVPRHPFLRATRSHITMLQILQMFVGMYVSWAAFLRPWATTNPLQHQNTVYAFIMYASYAYLFVLFYLENYVKGVKPSMGVAVGAIHIAGAAGVVLLLRDGQAVRTITELAIVYFLASGIRRQLNVGPSHSIRQYAVRLSSFLLNPWLTWAIENQAIKRAQATLASISASTMNQGTVAASIKSEGRIQANSSIMASPIVDGNSPSLTRDLVAADVTTAWAHIQQTRSNPPKIVDSTDRLKCVLDAVPNPISRLVTVIMLIAALLAPIGYVIFARPSMPIMRAIMFGFLVHGCLRWCAELHTATSPFDADPVPPAPNQGISKNIKSL